MKHCLALSTGSSLIARLLLATPVQAETARLAADGYRLSRYRSPTPDQVRPGDKGGPLVFNCRADCRPDRKVLKRGHPLGDHNRNRIDGWPAASPHTTARPAITVQAFP
ncbi:hypothetical protein PH586_19635 [Pseudomonas sp. SA3-5]|uniref:Uncharacterized protein n=1 Tax=Pseudomonas aestuarii TaxID=3018340 RepID=A0ABT4XK46_9PSED|nr:hypothetical protein [Pseudomonas aestuarii]MDA7088597.1 hypothetical protein [Pseudomonas aestuarii]